VKHVFVPSLRQRVVELLEGFADDAGALVQDDLERARDAETTASLGSVEINVADVHTRAALTRSRGSSSCGTPPPSPAFHRRRDGEYRHCRGEI
jgi:hypothetical protein